MLIEKGADINALNKYNDKPLHLASKTKDMGFITDTENIVVNTKETDGLK